MTSLPQTPAPATGATPEPPSTRAVGTSVGLFAGIGGIELGLSRAGYRTKLLCDSDPAAREVLAERFAGVPVADDVVELSAADVRGSDVLAGGFPCQDLSQAGRRAGIAGSRSGLVEHMLRLLDDGGPSTLVVENVPFMLALDAGRAMSWLAASLEERGFNWAYRVVDAMAFGLPQRRKRVLLVASKDRDPRGVLLNEDHGAIARHDDGEVWCGFYWTEGNRGLGWAVDAVPPLKGGSGVGIPSAPGIWQRGQCRMATPSIRDAEALQGFARGWTDAGSLEGRKRTGARWRMVGNAVNVRVADWLGARLARDDGYVPAGREFELGSRWPKAAWGIAGVGRRGVEVSDWPVALRISHLSDLVRDPQPLSEKATLGFFGRLERSSLRYHETFMDDHRAHLEWLRTRDAS